MSRIGGGHPRRWAVLALVLAAECMDLMDGTIVNVAAPTIRTDLKASATALQWIISGYSLAFAIGLITGARLGDRYGRKRLFVAGSAAFGAASLAAALAVSPGTAGGNLARRLGARLGKRGQRPGEADEVAPAGDSAVGDPAVGDPAVGERAIGERAAASARGSGDDQRDLAADGT